MTRPSLINEVYDLMLEGKSYSEIAKELGKVEITIKYYAKQIFIKNNVKNRHELLAKIIKELKDAGRLELPRY